MGIPLENAALAALLLIQLPANMPRKPEDHGPSSWTPAAPVEDSYWLPVSAWPIPNQYNHMGSEAADGKMENSFSVTLCLSNK